MAQAAPPTEAPADEKRVGERTAAKGAVADTTPEALRDAANRKDTEDQAIQVMEDATAWYLAPDPEEDVSLSFGLNVAPAGRKPRWVKWTVRGLERKVIKAIRTNATKNGEEDDMEVNLRVAIAGTVVPDIMAPEALQMPDGSGQFADPADALQYRFQHKPGLIDRIANKVQEASGYLGEQVKDLDAAKN